MTFAAHGILGAGVCMLPWRWCPQPPRTTASVTDGGAGEAYDGVSCIKIVNGNGWTLISNTAQIRASTTACNYVWKFMAKASRTNMCTTTYGSAGATHTYLFTSGWAEYTWTSTADNTSIKFQNYETGTLYLDNIRVYEVP